MSRARKALSAGWLSPLFLIAFSTAFGQTPWEAVPAKPAEVPNKYQAPSAVQSLPPPPSGKPVVTHTSPAISTPAFVPITPNAAPRTEVSPLRPTAGGGLIPDSLSVPPRVIQPPANRHAPRINSAFELPLPPPEILQSIGVPAVSPSQTSVPGSLIAYEPSVSADVVETSIADVEAENFDAGKLIAVVGTDHILAGDVSVFIEPIIESNRDKLRSAADEERVRSQLTRQALGQYIEIKALYREFFRDMVGTAPPKEIAEMTKKVETKASKIFFEKQVPNLMKKYDVADMAGLEESLREKSMSIHTLRSQFVEQVLSGELERKYIPADFDFSREELLKYYQQHRDDWEIPAKARWRQLTIRFDKHDSDRDVVDALIKQLGNEVYLGGKPFEAVAKQSSEGYTASEGGVYDWTTQGSLKSASIDEALFSLPLNRLSRVIVDDIGMHIIEVLERQDASTKEFSLAQAEIRENLSNEKRISEIQKFRRQVLARTPIWSLWPEDLKERAKHARPLSEAIGENAEN